MSDELLVAVEVPLVGDPRRKSWAKIVESVDESRSGGYAFGGYFVAAGGVQDLPVDGALIVYGERGSRANPRAEARVYTVNPDATLSHCQTAQGRAWARTIRDGVADLLGERAPVDGGPRLEWSKDLGRFTTAALLEELERRGWSAGA